MSGAVIHRVQLAAAHDGVAEMVVTLRFENGGLSPVTLDEHAARALMQSCQANAPDDLIGTGWELVRDALAASSARYMTT